MRPTPARRPHRAAAFTLVELLVVIGIIALLISILVPTLSGARRSANAVKCASALKQIGNAFKLYEIDSKGYWPITVFYTDDPTVTGNDKERRWSDMLSKYFHKTELKNSGELDRVRRNSVLWGCPEFAKSIDFENTTADRLRNGYAMSTQTMAPAAPTRGTDKAKPGNLAYIDLRSDANRSIGTWFRATVWTRRSDGGSANRGLVADSSIHTLSGSSEFSMTNGTFFGGPVFSTSSTAINETYLPTGNTALPAEYIQVDGARHVKPTRNINTLRNSKGLNMLFCDMSVRPVTPAEAWLHTVGGNGKAFKNAPKAGPF